MLDIYREIVNIITEGGEAALATIVSASHSTPRGVGAKMLVKPDGSILGSVGGGNSEKETIKEALNVIRTGKPKRLHFSLVPRRGEDAGMICGGEMEVFVEPILQSPTMYLFGGGHISVALAKVARLVDFKVVLIEDRAEFATAERFPEAEIVLAEDYEQSFSKLKVDRSSYVVIITTNHKSDEVVLGKALGTPAKYIGMIGSKTKFKTIALHLTEKGITKQQLGTVHTPMGVDICAETPEEIAVSIMAEIIKVHRAP
ncbi:MAG: XdhC/CoxI family protein [Dehalococcoidia bacterium]|nr:XdhC/CoxI family protein [Dehalococcoidia bacterium]